MFSKVATVAGETIADQLLAKLQSTTEIFRSAKVDKKVMLTFYVDGEKKASKPWDPPSQDLAVVIDAAGYDVADLDLQAELHDNDDVFLIDVATKQDVETLLQYVGNQRFLKVNASIRQPSFSERAKVRAAEAMDSASSWLHNAKKQIVGEVPEETVVRKAEKELIDKKAVEGMEQKVVALEHEGYNITYWPTAVATLAKSLNLTDDEKSELELAQHMKSGRKSLFHHKRNGSILSTAFTSYRTIREDGVIHIVYGHFQHQCSRSLATSAERHTVQFNGRLFKVLPEATPYSMEAGSDMTNQRFSLPPGAKVVDSKDGEFVEIVSNVIKPYSWDTNFVVVHDAGTWRGYATMGLHKRSPASFQPGQVVGDLKYLMTDSTAFWFTTSSFRLLVEVPPPPSSDAELTTQLQRYVEASARREWAKLLNLNVGMGNGDASEIDAPGPKATDEL